MEFKQVIVVRTDLKMSKGKLAVQVAHAAVEALICTQKSKRQWVNEWLKQGQKKVVLKVRDETELINLYKEFKELGLPICLIADAGKTELPPGTITALGVGPAPSELIDKITGRLKPL